MFSKYVAQIDYDFISLFLGFHYQDFGKLLNGPIYIKKRKETD